MVVALQQISQKRLDSETVASSNPHYIAENDLSHIADFPPPRQDERVNQNLNCQPGDLDKCYCFLQVKEEVQALLKGMSNLLRIDDLEPTEVYYCKNDSGSNHHNKLINSTEKY